VTAQGGPAICIDVRDYVARKIAAIAAHRTQFPIRPDMLPLAMLQDMMGREYFVPVTPGAAVSVQDRASQTPRMHHAHLARVAATV
jgi:hypothetical protein